MPGLLILIFCVLGYAAVCPDDDKLPQVARFAGVAIVVLLAFRAITSWLDEQVRLAKHTTRLKQLDAFASRLVRGTTDGRGFYSGGITTVSGQLDGRELQLLVRLGPTSTIAFELRVPDGLQIHAHRPSLPAYFFGAGPVVALARGAPRAELESLLRQVLIDRGLARVVAGGGSLRAEKTFRDADLRLEWLESTARALGRIARLAQAQEPRTTSDPGKALDAGEVRCPFCHAALDLGLEEIASCGACKTAHHRDCFSEAGGCTVFGCPGAGRAVGERGHVRAKGEKGSQGPHNFLGERSRARS